MAVGFAWTTRDSATSSYWLVVGQMFFMGGGLGLVNAPATEAIMGALPPAKAGVGSAVNDTTRQVGGALGVAIIGSVYSSIYGSQIAHAIGSAGVSLPADVSATVNDSVGGALGVATKIGGPQGQALADAARAAFVEGMHRGVLVGAAIALVGALVALFFLPARAPESGEGGVDPDEPNVFGLIDGQQFEPIGPGSRPRA
ncbi:MAG TPA: hypothetical protein VF320_11045, partial [Acidimicrobiales bacterium]